MVTIDTNVFSSITNPGASDYEQFKPVVDWVLFEKRACFVYGGSKYREELRGSPKMLALLNQLRIARKAVVADGAMVDAYQAKLEARKLPKRFNDPHLAAIVEVSHCPLVATKDKGAMLYITKSEYYETTQPPQIYSGAQNKDLLCVDNIIDLQNVS
jgi:hypothetical protein